MTAPWFNARYQDDTVLRMNTCDAIHCPEWLSGASFEKLLLACELGIAHTPNCSRYELGVKV